MILSKKIYYCLICLFISESVNCGRILAYFLVPAVSHQSVFRAYINELAKHGHDIVLLSPMHSQIEQWPPENVTEIIVDYTLDMVEPSKVPKGTPGRGIVADLETLLEIKAVASMIDVVVNQLKHPELQRLLNDKIQKFDLIIVETIMHYQLILSHIIKAPIIQFSSSYGSPENLETMGAVSHHPILYPHYFRNRFRNLNVWQKIIESYNEYRLYHCYKEIEGMEDEQLKINFGPDAPTVHELKNNVDMLFLNSYPAFSGNHPIPSTVIYLGGLHLKPVQELPMDLKDYLDNSSHGVIYVSLGTTVTAENMSDDLLQAFLNAFKALPYDFLWKFSAKINAEVSPNIKIETWFPQRDLLTHPNVKVFISQGGLQSTDEAIDAAVPLVGIPCFVDQWYNVNKYVELGIGVEVDALTMTADDLINAINTIMSNQSTYRNNIKRVRNQMYDQPQSPIERAIWWTEYVLRHGGAKHLRAPSANMSWTEYLMIDVIVVLMLIFILLLLHVVFIVLALYKVSRWFLNSSKIKQS